MADSFVLTIPVTLLNAMGSFQGYATDVHGYIPTLLNPQSNCFILRSEAESNRSYKQIIPYVVLRYQDSVFTYVRGKKSSESRLVAMRSIGVGGHIEQSDQNLFSSDMDMYVDAMKREVNEEVMVQTTLVDHIVALINDDSTEVGKVHLGIMHIWDLAEPKVTKKEGLITQAGFMAIDDLKAKSDELETWSQIALQVLQDKQVPTYLPLSA